LVADGAHARELDSAGVKLRIHVAIDTGMHRLGVEASNITELESLFKFENLVVEACATHLASSDSLDADDIGFTREQLRKFNAVIDLLREKGLDVGKLHAQASYGVFNHPDLEYDWVRVGIGLYGVLGQYGATKVDFALRPVLSLKAHVVQTRSIGPGEAVSYGRMFTSTSSMRLATVSIGYNDGLPRQSSDSGAMCLVRGFKVPIVGRICMDMLMIDVTGIDQVKPGDVVTLIGNDGDEEIRCEDVAAWSGTISYEILCRINGRLPRVYKE
jgi:serine/alanine racemase